MALQGDDYISRGAFMRRIRKLEREVETMKAERRLEAASIGAGGLTVKGGFIRILDANGNETMRLATDGLSLEGLLSVSGDIVVDGGSIEVVSSSGATVFKANASGVTMSGDLLVGGDTTLTGILDVTDAGAITWRDVTDLVRIKIAIEQFAIDALPQLTLKDAAGVTRAVFGELDGATGASVGHGIRVFAADGETLRFSAGGDDSVLSSPGNTFITGGTEVQILRPVDQDAIIRITQADGLRIAVDTDAAGVQSGKVTAGPADSAGAGFRTLRIPN